MKIIFKNKIMAIKAENKKGWIIILSLLNLLKLTKKI